MNILYYSVHQILEDDEVRLFKELGHSVFCLGLNGKNGALQNFRPRILFSEYEKTLYDDFDRLGGRFVFGDLEKTNLPKDFCDNIDIFIVMHDPHFIKKFWNVMAPKPIVWRTIGQGVDSLEGFIKPFRDCGLSIVRYSPIENEIPENAGADAVIRFFKNPDVYDGWTGESASIITFSNLFSQRYANDYSDYIEIVKGIASELGGMGNDGLPNVIGMVDFDEQLSLLRTRRAYLYASGLYIPYTLNFMEAWMTGIPVVVHAPLDRATPFFEIDRLVEHGVNGFVCRSIDRARTVLQSLIDDDDLAFRIGHAGRQKAIELFGRSNIAPMWQSFLNQAKRRSTQPIGDRQVHPEENAMKNMSDHVFEALSLLRPFDIDFPKIRIGNARDGGYVLADLGSTPDILSFGVGPDITFEYEMAIRGRQAYLHDHTVEAMPQTHPRLHFTKRGVCGRGSESEELTTIEGHLSALAISVDTNLLLKIDVEGHEWDVFSTIEVETLERFEQIAIEIHWLENLAVPEFQRKVVQALSKINRIFTLFHVHANNCAELHLVEGFVVASVLELSYVRTSLVRRKTSRTLYPSPLDLANHPSFHDHPLLFYPFLPCSVPDEEIKGVVRRIELEKRSG